MKLLTEVNKSYGIDCPDFKDCLSFLTEDTVAKYLPELQGFSEEMKLSDKQYDGLKNTLISSAKYMVSERCEYNSSLKLSEPPDLQALSLLNKKQFIEFVDKICSIGKETLFNVENTMKNIYQKRRTENERNELRGRSVRDAESDTGIHDRSVRTGASERADRALRSSMDEVDGTGISLKNDSINNGMPVADNSSSDRQGSGRTSRAAEQTILREASATSDGISGTAGLGEGTDNVDRPHNNDGDSLSVEKLKVTNQAVSEQDTAFVMSEEILQACFEEACNSGSGFDSGKTRIYHALKEDLTTAAEKASFLKNEYGIGGRSCNYKPYPISGFFDYDSKGLDMKMSLHGNFCDTTYHYSWSQVANQIDKLIESGKYLIPVPHSYSNGDVIFDDDRILKVFSIDEERKKVHLFDITYGENYNKDVYKSMEEVEAIYSPIPNAEITGVPQNTVIVNNEYVPEQLAFGLENEINNKQLDKILYDTNVISVDENVSIDDFFNIFSGKKELDIKETNGIVEVSKKDSKPIKIEISDSTEQIEKKNYHFSPDNVVFGGQKTRYKSNIEAIKTLQSIENEHRLAAASEQDILAKYVGWGGILR